jgi:hypothetical protein
LKTVKNSKFSAILLLSYFGVVGKVKKHCHVGHFARGKDTLAQTFAHARQVPSSHGDGGEGKGAAGRDGFHSGGAGGARALQAH